MVRSSHPAAPLSPLGPESTRRRGEPWGEGLPAWAAWSEGAGRRFTIGVEEELMLLDPADGSLSHSSGEVLKHLPAALAARAKPETHAAVVELSTGIHHKVTSASAELARLRARMAAELRGMGLGAACAGTHPARTSEDARVSTAHRYQLVSDSMRALARREPTMALHVHIGVPDPGDAVRLLNALRRRLPLLVALAANSPFCQGRDSGFASLRTLIFKGFPRTGPPREFRSYRDWVRAVDPLIASGAVPDPTFLWWDVRLQPALGTVEVRALDAQATVADSRALIALIQSLAHLELEDGPPARELGQEVLSENCFLAARDGLDARLIDHRARRSATVRHIVAALVEQCRPHADRLGCQPELEQVGQLAAANGAERQRGWASQSGSPRTVIGQLGERFEPTAADLAPRPGGPPGRSGSSTATPGGSPGRAAADRDGRDASLTRIG